jgi:hypothetical protein
MDRLIERCMQGHNTTKHGKPPCPSICLLKADAKPGGKSHGHFSGTVGSKPAPSPFPPKPPHLSPPPPPPSLPLAPGPPLPSGALTFYDASGPDESGASGEKRQGAVYLTTLAKTLMHAAASLAPIIGDSQADVAGWLHTAERLVVNLNEIYPGPSPTAPGAKPGPRSGGWHPEFYGYPLGQHIKQSDVTMLNFPFMYSMPNETLRNDLDAYPVDAKNQNMQGMNLMSLVVGLRDVGDDDLAARYWHNLTTQLTEGPFLMWMEKTEFASKKNLTRVSSDGAPNYLTSPGGWLQSTWAGWGGLRLNASALQIRRPTPPPNTTAMTLNGVRFRGNLIDIRVDAAGLAVTVRDRAASGGVKAAQLTLAAGAGTPSLLKPGATVRAPVGGGVVTIAAIGDFDVDKPSPCAAISKDGLCCNPGALNVGPMLHVANMTLKAAAAWCNSSLACSGFTAKANPAHNLSIAEQCMDTDDATVFAVYFKTMLGGNADPLWSSWRKVDHTPPSYYCHKRRCNLCNVPGVPECVANVSYTQPDCFVSSRAAILPGAPA